MSSILKEFAKFAHHEVENTQRWTELMGAQEHVLFAELFHNVAQSGFLKLFPSVLRDALEAAGKSQAEIAGKMIDTKTDPNTHGIRRDLTGKWHEDWRDNAQALEQTYPGSLRRYQPSETSSH